MIIKQWSPALRTTRFTNKLLYELSVEGFFLPFWEPVPLYEPDFAERIKFVKRGTTVPYIVNFVFHVVNFLLILVLLFTCLVDGLADRRKNYLVHIRGTWIVKKESLSFCVFQTKLRFL